MKYFIIISIAVISIASSFWSCQKEDLGNLDGIFSDTAQAGPVSQMAARINDVPWSATSYDLTLTPGNPGQIIITGQADNGQTITLVVNSSKAGDYLLSRLSPGVATYSPDSTGGTIYKSNDTLCGGVINIDTIDTANMVMTGQFNFIGGIGAKNRATVTDGTFVNIGYINTAATTQFAAKVNGSSWVPETVSASVSATNVLTITAINANGTKMVLSFPAGIKTTKTGYPLTTSGRYAAYYYDAGTTLVPDLYSAHNKPKLACGIKIFSNNTTSTPRNIRGTFSFYGVPSNDTTAVGSRIASGQFNMNY